MELIRKEQSRPAPKKSSFEQGVIVAYNIGKGWGFIETADGTSIFFHISNSPDFKPERGLVVQFEMAPGFKLGQHDQAVRLREVTFLCGDVVETDAPNGGDQAAR